MTTIASVQAGMSALHAQLLQLRTGLAAPLPRLVTIEDIDACLHALLQLDQTVHEAQGRQMPARAAIQPPAPPPLPPPPATPPRPLAEAAPAQPPAPEALTPALTEEPSEEDDDKEEGRGRSTRRTSHH